jgi:predicted PurR-regulated permease PerM
MPRSGAVLPVLLAGRGQGNTLIGGRREFMADAQNPGRQLNIGHYFLVFLIVLALFFCWQIMKPYIDPVILALILAVLTSPVNDWLVKRFRGKENVAALTSCLLLIIVIVVPVVAILSVVIRQGIHSFSAIQHWIAAGNFNTLLNSPLITRALALADKYLPVNFLENMDLGAAAMQVSSSAGKWLVSKGGYFIGNLSLVAGKFFIMIFVFFFAVKDRKQIIDYVLHLIPLSTDQENILAKKIKDVARSAILGSLVTALAQGAAGGLAFAICGLPGFFWGAVMAFASLIPVVGTALVWVPAAGYLLISEPWGYGLFMIIWCVLVVGMIDNLVRPLFMSGAAGMSTVLIFFSILGGISYFGLAGLLYGPLVFGITMVLLYIYSLEFEVFLKRQDHSEAVTDSSAGPSQIQDDMT